MCVGCSSVEMKQSGLMVSYDSDDSDYDDQSAQMKMKSMDQTSTPPLPPGDKVIIVMILHLFFVIVLTLFSKCQLVLINFKTVLLFYIITVLYI